ncbi:MAG TPA: anthranilate synthase component I [bacterium]|jgi:anthranilate synthase component 1|nr:anthranilate synthase component I [bacterium]
MKKSSVSNVIPSFKSFSQLARQYNRIPVSLAFQSDLETPLSAYLKLAKGDNGFLLESVEKNEQVARYSIVGFDPSGVFEAKNGFLNHRVGKGKDVQRSANPLQIVKEKVSSIRQAPLEGVTGFLGGLVGFVGYDAVRYFEKLPHEKPDILDLPDLYLMVTDQLALFDHLKRTLRLIVNVPIEPNMNLKKVYAGAVKKLAGLSKKMEEPLKGVSEIPVTPFEKPGPNDLFGFKSNMTPETFEAMVGKSKEYIKAGDIIQVVGSQRFEKEIRADAVTIYRVLRRLNPSPYMFILKTNGMELVGSSPEMMIKVQEGIVETRPIAGSRPRGKTPAEDQALADGLLKDQKELAEHVMLVDLARNDLGRVCDFGTVKVNQFEIVERYSHIMHIVSDVTGKLKKDKTAYDAFQSCFPAGTLSGAPKIRAMEIIEELEPSRRGLYGGAVVAFGFDGNMDSAITIRSVVLKNQGKKRTAYVQAGAGLVADSVPQTEYMESCNKARAVLMAIHQAEKANTNVQHEDTKTPRKAKPNRKTIKPKKSGKGVRS